MSRVLKYVVVDNSERCLFLAQWNYMKRGKYLLRRCLDAYGKIPSSSSTSYPIPTLEEREAIRSNRASLEERPATKAWRI